jgi:hypothetical protein
MVRSKTQHILASLVLASYVLVGAFGIWTVLNDVFRFGPYPYVISKCKAPTQQPVKVAWTQHKYIPSASRDFVPMPACLLGHAIRDFRQSTGVVPPQMFIAASDRSLFSHSTRAPPQV